MIAHQDPTQDGILANAKRVDYTDSKLLSGGFGDVILPCLLCGIEHLRLNTVDLRFLGVAYGRCSVFWRRTWMI